MDTFKRFLRGAIVFGVVLTIYWKPILGCSRSFFPPLASKSTPFSPVERDYIRRHTDDKLNYNNLGPLEIRDFDGKR